MSNKKIIKRHDYAQKTVSEEPLKIFIAIAPFLVGMYYEWASSIAVVFLLCYLWYCFMVAGEIQILRSVSLLAATVIPATYGISTFWAVDSGLAFFGMIKFLPLPLFVLAAEQVEKEFRKNLLDYVPVSGMIMMIVSEMLGVIPVLEPYFRVNGRLAGFFQYPNTFALYLLVGIIVLISKGCWNKIRIVNLLLLFVGILLTGSRTGFILLVVTVLSFCLLIREKRIRLGLIGVLVLLVVLTGAYAIMTGSTSSVGRYLTASFSSSTFLGRMLYYKDAIPVILRHPFGLGYMGYYFTQGAFQTGVYSIINIHNEFLQFLLDIGWIPTGILIWVVIRGIISSGLRERMLIIMILLHSMLDFNLQFISIFFVMLSAVDLDGKKIGRVSGKEVLMTGVVLLGCTSLYFGMDSALYYMKMYSTSAEIYPGNTNAWMQLLTVVEEPEEMERVADRILALNPDNPLANNAKARVAYSNGDFGSMIGYKQQALEYYKYNLEEYLDYFNMLYVGYQLYLENSDPDSAEVCREQMLGIPDMLDEVLNETDPLAYQIQDKPELELPEEYRVILDVLR